MDPLQRQFTQIIQTYGFQKCVDQRWFTALLRDLLSAAPRQINALADAASDRIPAELAQLGNDPHAILKHAQLKSKLIANRGWQDDLATWTIEAWAAAIHSSNEDGKSFVLKCPECGNARSLAGRMIGEVVPCGHAACSAKLRVFAEGRSVATESDHEISSAQRILVATDGSGQFTSLSEALSSTPEDVHIVLRGGPYEGAFVITKATVITGADPKNRVVIRSSNGTCFLVRSGSLRLENLDVEVPATATGATKPVLEVNKSEAEFENCSFRSSIGETAKIHGERCRVRFNHCILHSSRRGGVVVFDRANVSLNDCTLDDIRGTAVSVDSGAKAQLSACRIEKSGGSAVCSRGAELQIHQCRITNAKDYGIDISGGAFEVTESVVTSNGTRAVWVRNNAKGRIEKCDLRGNRRGAVSFSPDCNVVLVDNLAD